MEPTDRITLAHQFSPSPLRDLATREQLVTWLTRILLHILVPGRRPEVGIYHFPNNLVNFINLLIHLNGTGFPAHWLSEYLSTILTDQLITDVAPYVGVFPIPFSERTRRVPKRKLNLSPWLSDLENILAVSYEAVPFPLGLPEHFARSADEIGLFEAETAYRPEGSDAVNALMFCKSTRSPFQFIDSLNEVLEGRLNVDSGEMQILTVIDTLDMIEKVVKWKMSKKRVKMMKREGWYMLPYRFDIRGALGLFLSLMGCDLTDVLTIRLVSEPVHSSRWKEVIIKSPDAYQDMLSDLD